MRDIKYRLDNGHPITIRLSQPEASRSSDHNSGRNSGRNSDRNEYAPMRSFLLIITTSNTLFRREQHRHATAFTFGTLLQIGNFVKVSGQTLK